MSSAVSIEIDSGEDGITRFFVSENDRQRPLSDLLDHHGYGLNTRCGGRGLCGGCRVSLLEGTALLSSGPISAPSELNACQTRLTGNLRLSIPTQCRTGQNPQVEETFRIDTPLRGQPVFDPVPGVRDVAFAVDIGTTTVVVLLVDLGTGTVLSRAGGFNGQIRYGDNVLTRIEAAREPATLTALQETVISATIAPLLRRACERARIYPSRLCGGALSGNTTMLHLLTATDPTSLGVAPFTPRFLSAQSFTTDQLRLNLPGLDPDTPLRLLPGIAAYVGADITAGIHATGMIFDRDPSLLVDVGTNGEIVLHHEGRLLACATAAGPAFEGSGLSCGTRAQAGAISSIQLGSDPWSVRAEVIGNTSLKTAFGICGSAYIDFLSQARECGLLTEHGRFQPTTWSRLPESLKIDNTEGRAFRVSERCRISEVDVALLLQAKAAIAAGIETLLDYAGIGPNELDRVYLAGGFGMHLNLTHATGIGLLPRIPSEKIRVVGNSALAGTLLSILDAGAWSAFETIRARTELIELNLQDTFEDSFIDHLSLP